MNLRPGQPMSNCPCYASGMKMNCIIKPARILLRFGRARLIRGEDGKYELVGGSEGDYTEAKEWVSLFAHEIVFSRPMKRRQHLNLLLGQLLSKRA